MAKKILDDEAQDAIVENTKEPRIYELAFHIDPEKTESEADKIFDAVKKVAGEVIAEGTPHKIQLAYTISRMTPSGREDFDGSYFAWFAYEADGVTHDAVLEAVKAQKPIFRHLDIITTKEEAEEAQELHALRMEEAREKDVVEEDGEVVAEVADQELDQALKEVV